MTFTNDNAAVDTIRGMMMSSWETYVSYTMPLGLHHLIGGNHYAPMPENNRAPRSDWTAVYYHRADAEGIGVDRTRRGNKAVEQYFQPVRDRFDNEGRTTKAFRVRNVVGVGAFIARTVWDVYIARDYRVPPPRDG